MTALQTKSGFRGIRICEIHEQRVHASPESDAQRRRLSSNSIVRDESNKKNEIWVAKLLWYCRFYETIRRRRETGICAVHGA